MIACDTGVVNTLKKNMDFAPFCLLEVDAAPVRRIPSAASEPCDERLLGTSYALIAVSILPRVFLSPFRRAFPQALRPPNAFLRLARTAFRLAESFRIFTVGLDGEYHGVPVNDHFHVNEDMLFCKNIGEEPSVFVDPFFIGFNVHGPFGALHDLDQMLFRSSAPGSLFHFGRIDADKSRVVLFAVQAKRDGVSVMDLMDQRFLQSVLREAGLLSEGNENQYERNKE